MNKNRKLDLSHDLHSHYRQLGKLFLIMLS